jgi:hypothetical protein
LSAFAWLGGSAGWGFGAGPERWRAVGPDQPLAGQAGAEPLPLPLPFAGALGDLGPPEEVARTRPVALEVLAAAAAAERPAPRDQMEPPGVAGAPVVRAGLVGLPGLAGLVVLLTGLAVLLELVVLVALVVLLELVVLLVVERGGRSSGGAGRLVPAPGSAAEARRTEGAPPAMRRVPPVSPSESVGEGGSGRSRAAYPSVAPSEGTADPAVPDRVPVPALAAPASAAAWPGLRRAQRAAR